MTADLQKHKDLLISYKSRLSLLQEQKQKRDAIKNQLADELAIYTKARDIIVTVAVATGEQLKVFVEEVTSLALKTVFGEMYQFHVNYEVKRNKSEAVFSISRDGQIVDPKDSVGGGVLDVASLGLRMSLFALADPMPTRILVLDEPAKMVSRGEKIQQFGMLLQKISELFDMQIIMISHDSALLEYSDASYQTELIKGRTSRVISSE